MFRQARSLAPLAALGSALALAACAAAPEPGTPAAAVHASISEAPDWFTSLPTDSGQLFSSGTATSGDMQMALDKATLNAKRSLADLVKGSISARMKEFIAESGTGEDPVIVAESERITTNLITDTNLAGYSRSQTKLVPQGGVYRAFVLLQYPKANADRLLAGRVQQDKVMESKLRASKAFQELEDEIKAAR